MQPAFDWRPAPADGVEREYSQSSVALRPLAEHLADYARESAAAGDPRALRVPGRPLLAYVHGGYWQELSAAEAPESVRTHGVPLRSIRLWQPEARRGTIATTSARRVRPGRLRCAPTGLNRVSIVDRWPSWVS